MHKLQHYSSNNDLEQFVETFNSLMVSPHSDTTKEHLRRVLTSTLPFFIFDTVYTDHHTRLRDLLENNIRAGNINFHELNGGAMDMQYFVSTLSTTPNLKAVEALYPVIEALSTTQIFTPSLAGIYDQMAQLQQQRISQALETGVQSPVKRKI